MADPVGETPRDRAVEKVAVRRFAVLMEGKLALNSHKAHWSGESTDRLLRRLVEEVEELREALTSGTPRDISGECADVANFAMMIADNRGVIRG